MTYKKTILPNGIRVVSEYIPHVRSVSLGIWVDVGSRHENEENNGIVHFIEHMVFKGTKNRNSRAIAQSLEKVGGYLNAFTGKEHTCFYARVLDEHLELALDVLSDMILSPTFPSKEIAKEKNVVIEELHQAEDDPDDVIHDYFEKALFHGHPLSLPVIGNEKSILSFTRKQLVDFKNEFYGGNQIVVSVAGNVRHEQVIELCSKYLKKIKTYQNSKPTTVEKIIASRQDRIDYGKPIKQAHICMGTLGYDIRSKERFPLQVLNTLVGDGMSSRLFQNIRERYGFAYSIYSFNNNMSDTGDFGAYIATDNAHVDRCIDLVWREFEKVKSSQVTKKELSRAKAQLKGSLILGLESISNRMIRLGSSELYFGELTSLDTIIQWIDEVTAEEIERIANELFQGSRFMTVIFRPDGK